MSGFVSLPVVLAAAALLTALCALGAAVMAWLAADRQARMVAELGARLSEIGDQIEMNTTERAAPAAGSEIGALRDDLAILFEHVAALTSGQLDLKKIVGAAVSRQIAPVLERFDQADERADERNSGVHRRIELVQEQLTDVADDLAALAARPAAQIAAIYSGEVSAATSTSDQTEPALERADAGREGVSVADPEPSEIAPSLIDRPMQPDPDALPDTVATDQDALPSAPRRTPAVFDSGRVAMMMPARRKEIA